MGLLDKLTQAGSSLSNNNGATPITMEGVDPQSALHNEYSLNGNPNKVGKPSPSVLDMNGAVPPYNYRDNAPEGKSF
jgi:hypothetical protein